MDETGLIVGLGNPGPRYADTRHNMGFMLLDLLAATPDPSGRMFLARERQERNLCEVYRFFAPGARERWYAVRPETFMNRSGRAVVWAANYYKTPLDRILVIHDELDLPLGRLRFKRGGGTAGHNGLKSIAELTGSRDFPRLRLGIDKPEHGDTTNHVLGRFTDSETACVKDVLTHAAQAVLSFVGQGLETAMQDVNGLDLCKESDS